ncbi:hypothetical protein OIK40_09045 [Erythrobacter sp. sf7]|uniref:CTP synthetase n=1 Tax=Erythrobacter fulvus TaxID=2987523 RepID=A0ABT5JQW0_9SPHN|nr:hypothetical protein [Erythrobacter fulvus]MDC8754785.1 hypothetical protein [Erythrobacter fulvus]
MQDNKTAATVLRTLSIVMLLLALGILGARIFAGLDVPLPSIMGLTTVGIALLVVAQSNARKGDKPD